MRRLPLFTPLVLCILLHGYIGWRLIPALDIGFSASVLAVLALLVSALLIPGALVAQMSGVSARVGDAFAWAGFLAMGLFSSFFVLTLLRDLVMVPVWLWARLQPQSLDIASFQHGSALAVVALAGGISVLGFINARRLARVVDVELPIAGLPQALQGFTIVQLSDIHVGPTIKRPYLDAIVRRVNGLDADLVAITGDMIDGNVAQLREHVQPLADLRSRHGTYCVTGNHEYYHGVDQWLAEWRRLGLRVLMNEGELLRHDGEQLLIAGVTDYNGHHFGDEHRSDPAAAARDAAASAVSILLAHQPRSARGAADAGFQVQLSGHTHGGQFLPWNFFVPLQQPFVSGLKRLEGLWVYTSRGTGYWGPPLRFGAPSEITRLRLVVAV